MAHSQLTNCLVVPVQLNACYIDGGRTVTDAKADFTRLPWSSGQQDHNASTPFLGESILSPPFQDKNFELAKGVHVHWVLPKAHRTYPTGSNQPPAAPNRWLVKRKNSSSADNHWIVESDYINENSTIYNRNAVTTPTNSLGEDTGQPWVYQGRQMLLTEWQNETPPPAANYWKSFNKGALTAFGYGELSFNTFYPNCRSVFGFFDPLGNEGDEYEVMGWYDNQEDDIVFASLTQLTDLLGDAKGNPHLLKKLCEDGDQCPQWLSSLMIEGAKAVYASETAFRKVVKTVADPINEEVARAQNWLLLSRNGTPSFYKDLRAQLLSDDFTFSLNTLFGLVPEAEQISILEAYYNYGLQRDLNWTFNATTGYPDTSLYYATITVGASKIPTFEDVAVGNTGADALSCYLGNHLSANTTTSADDIAHQLNTLLLAGSIQNDLVDLDANLKETEHNQAFKAIDSGVIWRIRKMKKPSFGSKGSKPFNRSNELEEIPPLPEAIAEALNVLNVAQESYHKGLAEVESEKAQLYADWCKYMQVCYPPEGLNPSLPDDDLVKNFVEWELGKVLRKQGEVGRLSSDLTAKNCTASGEADIQLLTSYQNVQTLLQAFNKTIGPNNEKNSPYELSAVPAPRYYEAKDPVILFAAPTKGNEQVVLPSKEAFQVVWSNSIAQNRSTTANQEICSISDVNTAIGSNDFSSQSNSWSPQVLQWLTSFFPKGEGSNLGSSSGNYNTDFITENYSIHTAASKTPGQENDPTFDFTPKHHTTLPAALEYSGSTSVSVHTKKHMQDVLQEHLQKKYPKAVIGNTKEPDWKTIAKNVAGLPVDNIDHIAYHAYHHLEGQLILTQSLGGFNQALIQRANNIHLPVKDPLGFSSYQAFTESVRDLLNPKVINANGDVVRSKKTYPSPNIDDQFMPIRAGRVDLNKLTFLDYFGVETSMNFDEDSAPNIYVAKSLQMEYLPSGVWLNPRLTQASRLNFRWLAATSTGSAAIEMNSHPTTSPICGWLLPNYFDDSLVAYDIDGKGLGSLSFDVDSSAQPWSPFPGSEHPIDGPLTSNTPGINSHLLAVLLDIQNGLTSANPPSPSFLTQVQNGQDAISPEYYDGDSVAILMGKPIAVVRATISLETKGGLVTDQSWKPFQKQLNGKPGDTNNYEQVEFRIRLGDNGQLDDGLIAFWEDGVSGDARWVNYTNSEQKNTVGLTLSDAPKTLTMLMDPHGIVHATSGILPVKTIRIPTDQYSKALKNISVTFKTRPLLTPTSELQLSLPQEHGYSWSWLEQEPKPAGQTEPVWKVTPDIPLISKEGFSAGWNAYLAKLGLPIAVPASGPVPIPLPDTETLTGGSPLPDAATVWAFLLETNWVVPLSQNDTLFKIMPLPDAVDGPTREVSLANFVSAVENTLNATATGITPYNPQAQFYSQQHLLEGWLKISPSNNEENNS